MKKLLLSLLIMSAFVFDTNAQNFTKSYGCVGVATSMGPQTPPPGMATWIEFYDGYILVMGIEKFKYDGRNPDGSMRFYATRQGQPMLNTLGWVITRNYSSAKQVIQSTVMGMTMQMEYHFNYIGDGSEPAQLMMGGSSGSYGGGYGGNYGGGGDYTCPSCMGTRQCKFCNGTGRDEYGQNGRCGVCRGNGRCQACNR